MPMFRFRSLFAFLAVATALVFLAGEVDARPKFSGGSRGTRTYSQPAATPTAPGGGAPMERTMTQRPASPSVANAATPAAGGFMSRFGGFGGGLMAGLLGAGLIGMLMGNGFL